ncbi:MAG: MerR family transcriptional regulator [Ruminococcaceae bacterium]|nr:MerR family transcriptional regulator [Oscillospiraceae bacterium]MBE6708139.1 MerR family transcriptional regulator [Oscillospiraceae bacterium]
MEKQNLIDISEVCNMFNTTSRTLRHYEEKKIIESTTDGFSKRRKYTGTQIDNIRNVFVLRSLGLSIKDILQLQQENVNLKDTVILKRAEIIASIEKRMREINILNDAISVIEAGENIFDYKAKSDISIDPELIHITQECSDAIVFGQTEKLYGYLSENMLRLMPRDVYERSRKDTVSPLGDFVSFERIEADPKYPNRIYSFVKYRYLELKITLVFNDKEIDGLWLSYYNNNSR